MSDYQPHDTQPIRVPLADEQRPKQFVDYASQAFWLAMVLVAAPILAGRGFPVHALVVVVVGLASIAWIEHLARHGETKGAWAVFAVIMVVLGIRRATRDR